LREIVYFHTFNGMGQENATYFYPQALNGQDRKKANNP